MNQTFLAKCFFLLCGIVLGQSTGGHQSQQVLVDRLPGNIVDIVSGDHFFTAPESIPAGLTTFRLKQSGEFAHELSILKLPNDKTYEEFAALILAGQRAPWVSNLSGPGFIDPPLLTNATLVMEPGAYALVCLFPPPQNPPDHLRMIKRLQVVPSPTAQSKEPPADLIVRILDDDFEFSPSLAAGQHLVRVENATSERRFIRMERLLPGRTPEQALAWGRNRLTIPETERPTEPKGRIAGIEPGQHLLMTINIQPGTYLVSSRPARATSKVFEVR